jgi:hypothetical protein
MVFPKKTAGICVLLLLSAYIFCIQFDLLYIDVWCELEPFAGEKDTEYPLTKKQAALQILEEARFIISGMIYGFNFSYIPQDKKRHVAERFDLSPVARIIPGDTHLKIISTEQQDKMLFTKIEYRPADFQITRRTAWLSNAIPSSEGKGEGDLFKGYHQKITSYEQAIKNAIRNLLRPRYFNKPRRITGQALIEEAPQIFIASGKYVSLVKVKLKIREVLPYTVF